MGLQVDDDCFSLLPRHDQAITLFFCFSFPHVFIAACVIAHHHHRLLCAPSQGATRNEESLQR